VEELYQGFLSAFIPYKLNVYNLYLRNTYLIGRICKTTLKLFQIILTEQCSQYSTFSRGTRLYLEAKYFHTKPSIHLVVEPSSIGCLAADCPSIIKFIFTLPYVINISH
jgi:hypothetical protein